MKQLILIIFVGLTTQLFSQIETRPICDDVSQMPTELTYSGFIIYDEDQSISLANNLQLRLTVVTGTVDGTSIYSENRNVPASKNGFFTVKIGAGNSRSFDELLTYISENNGTAYFLNVELRDPNTFQYKLIGSKELLTVPYAIVSSVLGGRGETGPPGIDSDVQGPLGPQGPQGAIGAQGATGVGGVEGSPGEDGFGIMKMRSTIPNNLSLYIDDGTNTADGQPHVRYLDNGVWIDL